VVNVYLGHAMKDLLVDRIWNNIQHVSEAQSMWCLYFEQVSFFFCFLFCF